jgi:hypothetical protein
MKYQKEYFGALEGLNLCNSSNTVFAVSAGAVIGLHACCMAKICACLAQ